jgi:hypothetical protein
MPVPFPKLPTEVRLATANYSTAAEIVGGDTLASAAVSCDPSGLALGTPTVDSGANLVSFTIGSGTAGTTYIVSCLATTAGGEVIGAQVQVNVTNDLLV